MRGSETTEVAGALDLTVLRYSQVWEDDRVLGAALRPAGTILAVASAGCNALSLALGGAERVVAVDMSPAQIALCRLKVAALSHLDYPVLCAFWGLSEATRDARENVYERLRPHLAPSTQSYWDDRVEAWDLGPMHYGRFDRYLVRFAREFLAELWPQGAADDLLRAETLKEQELHFARACSDAFAAAFREYASRKMLGAHGRDPAQMRYVEQADLGDVFLERFARGCTAVPARGNPYLHYNLTGAYAAEALPTWLQPESFVKLRQACDRVEWREGTLEGACAGSERFDGFNFSDVFEYMSQDAADELFAAVADSGNPGARLAYWTLLVPRRPTDPAVALRELDLGPELKRQDRAWFYDTFHAFEVAR